MDQGTPIGTKRVYREAQHQNLLRIFAFSAFLSSLLILVLVGVGIYTIFNAHIIADAEQDAVGISNGIIGENLKSYIQRGPEGVPTLVVEARDFPVIAQNIDGKLKHFGVLKIKIFSNDKVIVYSNDRRIIGEADLKNQQLAMALAGHPSSKLENKDELWDLADEKKYEIDMVETYMPLRTGSGAVAGAFEIYMDVSTYRQGLKEVLRASLLVISLVLGAVFGVLTYFMRKATRIIYFKTEELKVLSGLLPICSGCKKIRNDREEWEILEKYITERSESEFTHSLCPDCLKHYWEQ